jgi:hypothetical protein
VKALLEKTHLRLSSIYDHIISLQLKFFLKFPEMINQRTRHVFISYVRENKEQVQRLCDELTKHGVEVWLDRKDIKPGARWKGSIRNAIDSGAFFLACFSKEYYIKEETHMNEELTIAIERLQKISPDRKWFIPVVLSGDIVPSRGIGGGETLRDIHCVMLGEDWEGGIKSILSVITPDEKIITVEPAPPGNDWRTRLHLDAYFRPISYLSNKFVSNSNETITDLATGLVWHKEGSVKPMVYGDSGKYTGYLNKSRFGSRNTWRLPTIAELLGLLEPQQQESGLYLDSLFTIRGGWVWSADSFSDSLVCCVDFRCGVFESSQRDHTNLAIAVSD